MADWQPHQHKVKLNTWVIQLRSQQFCFLVCQHRAFDNSLVILWQLHRLKSKDQLDDVLMYSVQAIPW